MMIEQWIWSSGVFVLYLYLEIQNIIMQSEPDVWNSVPGGHIINI